MADFGDKYRPYLDPKWLEDDPIQFQGTMSQAIGANEAQNGAVHSAAVNAAEHDLLARLSGSWSEMWTVIALQYACVFISQPFEVAKTVLQCQFIPRTALKLTYGQEQQSEAGKSANENANGDNNEQYDAEDEDDDDEDEESRFFVKSTPTEALLPPLPTDKAGYIQSGLVNEAESWRIALNTSSIKNTISAIRKKEGFFNLWKGQTASFLHNVFSSSLESWLVSFYSALLATPDPLVYDMIESPQPLMTLATSLLASATSALVLAPLDILKVKTIVAPSSDTSWNIIRAYRSLPFSTCPGSVVIPTVLYSTIPRAISMTVPMLLESAGLSLDPVGKPYIYHLATFALSVLQLTVRLPIETILRTAQLQASKPRCTIVPVRRYTGIAGTVWSMLNKEQNATTGLDSFYRGWKVGLWGIVGVWSLQTLGSIPQEELEF